MVRETCVPSFHFPTKSNRFALEAAYMNNIRVKSPLRQTYCEQDQYFMMCQYNLLLGTRFTCKCSRSAEFND